MDLSDFPMDKQRCPLHIGSCKYEKIFKYVKRTSEYEKLCGFFALPCNQWQFKQLLPLSPLFLREMKKSQFTFSSMDFAGE